MSWNPVQQAGQTWSGQSAHAQSWSAAPAVSSGSRLNRVFVQDDPDLPPSTTGLNFIWQVRSEGFWVVASGNHVRILSSITDMT